MQLKNIILIKINRCQLSYKMNQIIHASPKVRKFARQLGADISQLKGSERNGRITEEDVRNFIKNQIEDQKNPSKEIIKNEKKKNII